MYWLLASYKFYVGPFQEVVTATLKSSTYQQQPHVYVVLYYTTCSYLHSYHVTEVNALMVMPQS